MVTQLYSAVISENGVFRPTLQRLVLKPSANVNSYTKNDISFPIHVLVDLCKVGGRIEDIVSDLAGPATRAHPSTMGSQGRKRSVPGNGNMLCRWRDRRIHVFDLQLQIPSIIWVSIYCRLYMRNQRRI